MMFRKQLLIAVLGTFCAAYAPSAIAADPVKVTIGTTLLADVMPAFVAKDKGFFAKHGLDVSFTFVPLNPTIPAALMAGSIQVGAPNAAVFIQAADGGLDLQLIAGSTTTPSMGAGMAYVTRPDVSYDDPRSLEGRKIIIPGLGSSVDVLFRKWLAGKKVDERKISFVEIGSPQTDDALKAKSVDGAVVVEPFLTRVQQSGNGKLAVRFMDGLADEKLGISYIATRSWIENNRAAARAFSAAIDDAIAWANANQQDARVIVQGYTKLPQPVIDALPFPHMSNKLTPDAVSWWIDTMKEQNRIGGKLDPARLIAKP